ncbi:hypothetical protein [Mycobacterium tilburgii]|uniref:hypothetical protein n=1 Tax=Mycobacterium tilburgii TaxID=44467 RepID=UPI0021B326F1|nr:hypothetical protein [Mycobacterium tilburgii]
MSRRTHSQAITVLLFTEGRALVNLEFDSAPGNPTDRRSPPRSAKSKPPRSRTA